VTACALQEKELDVLRMRADGATNAASVTTKPIALRKQLSKKLSSWVLPSHYKPRERLTTSAEAEVCGSFEMYVKLAEEGSMDTMAMIRGSVIGNDSVVWTPYGKKRLVYADYTASGRMLGFIEDYFRDVVFPLYANTHTEASATGFQTTLFREEARAIVANAVNAPVEEYATLFVGTGCTGAIDKLGRVLGLQIPPWAKPFLDQLPEADRPVIFHGPFEHHTNELWWRESIATVVAIEEDEAGRPDMAMLQRELERYADRKTKIGSFSAGSNVTGICANTTALAEMLHAFGALAFFDFAGTGAYVDINMNPPPTTLGADASMDAIFLSPHKFIGGPGSSGLLVARRSLFTNDVPTCPGGGTVSYVAPDGRDYEEAIEAREDGGTPAILQAIRCGLAFKVKEMVGSSAIEHREQALGKTALQAWAAHPSILLMGSDRTGFFEYENRVSIISFNVLAPEKFPKTPATMKFLACFGGRFILHPHFLISVLNDVYGIQGRSGCSCTGPYGHRLFKLADPSNPLSAAIRKLAIENGEHAAKPGWARVNFNYFIDDAEAKFIRDAVLQIASDAWRLLPLYQMSPQSGQFVHRTFDRFDALRSLAELQFDDDACRYRIPCQEVAPPDYGKVLSDAKIIYENATQAILTSEGLTAEDDYSSPPSDALRASEWWCSPSLAAAQLRQAVPIGVEAEPRRRLSLAENIMLTRHHSVESARDENPTHEGRVLSRHSMTQFQKSEIAKIMRPRG
jgi:selenocysteine lyase/cysteine desulfurase